MRLESWDDKCRDIPWHLTQSVTIQTSLQTRNSGVIINREDMTTLTQQFRENTTPIKLSVYYFTDSTINLNRIYQDLSNNSLVHEKVFWDYDRACVVVTLSVSDFFRRIIIIIIIIGDNYSNISQEQFNISTFDKTQTHGWQLIVPAKYCYSSLQCLTVQYVFNMFFLKFSWIIVFPQTYLGYLEWGLEWDSLQYDTGVSQGGPVSQDDDNYFEILNGPQIMIRCWFYVAKLSIWW